MKKPEPDMRGPSVERYVNHVIASHRALALLRLNLTDPTLAPDAVHQAVEILEDAVEPLRAIPRRKAGKVPEPPRMKFSDQQEAIKRRIAAGMTTEAAALAVEWGVRIGPDGEDLDALAG